MSRSSLFATVFVAAAAFGIAAAPAPVQADSPPVEDKIVVRVTALRNNSGSVRCALYNDADGFPTSQKHVIARSRAVPADKAATCTFAKPASGKKYAVVIHHDENDDGQFQRNALGMPLEGYGFSNNVRPVVSAPSFADCAFSYAGGKHSIQIKMLY